MTGIKYLFLLIISLVVIASCQHSSPRSSPKEAVNLFLNEWHEDVAELRESDYFDKMASDFVFVGTDPGEVWRKEDFREFSHPFFAQGKTWNFKPLTRNLYFSEEGRFVWFDELLDTWMGLCRGCGVLVFEQGNCLLQHYVLSITVPNEDVDAVLQIKKTRDSLYKSLHITGSSGL